MHRRGPDRATPAERRLGSRTFYVAGGGLSVPKALRFFRRARRGGLPCLVKPPKPAATPTRKPERAAPTRVADADASVESGPCTSTCSAALTRVGFEAPSRSVLQPPKRPPIPMETWNKGKPLVAPPPAPFGTPPCWHLTAAGATTGGAPSCVSVVILCDRAIAGRPATGGEILTNYAVVVRIETMRVAGIGGHTQAWASSWNLKSSQLLGVLPCTVSHVR